MSTNYRYVDGNGNNFSIRSNAIQYDPVTPLESSSGNYSGGEPFSFAISEQQFNQLEQVFNQSIANKQGQTKQRTKGTGTLVVLSAKALYTFEANSVQKKEIEAILAALFQQNKPHSS
jgi:hypothetical protein